MSADQETTFRRSISPNTLRAASRRPDLAYETVRWLERMASDAWPALVVAACAAAVAWTRELVVAPSRMRDTSLRRIMYYSVKTDLSVLVLAQEEIFVMQKHIFLIPL